MKYAKKNSIKNFLQSQNLIRHKCVSRGAMAYDNNVIEALGKFMKVFNKKRMEMQRKCRVNSSDFRKGLTNACHL
jgi:hypothetical protein